MLMLHVVQEVLGVKMYWLTKALQHLKIKGVKTDRSGRVFTSEQIDRIKALRDSGWEPE
jgi:hypothetical protein